MERNDNNDSIKKARQRAENEKQQEANDNITNDEKESVENNLDENEVNENIEKKSEENKEEINTKNEVESEEVVNEEDKDSKEENVKKNKWKKKICIVVACFLVLIGIMYFGAKRYDNLVYPNITLYNEDVSKLNEKELKNKINDLSNDINENIISVKIKDKQYDIKVGDVIKDIDKEKIENKIMGYGKNKFFMEQFGLIYLGVKRDYQIDIKADENKVCQKVKEIYKKTTVGPIEPSLKIDGEEMVVVSGKNGEGINEESLINKIKKSINRDDIAKNNIVVTEKLEAVKPEISEKELATVKDKVSTATTYFAGTGNNRGLNIANAASKINGTLLMPGDEFSYEEAVSPVELYNGYYLAPVIVNGTHKNAPGGGVCQVCTTLYNAELKAGILPTERYNHSKAIGYIQRGLDATLATGSKNLRFKNPYKYPVYIRAYTVGGQITVEFWSNKKVLDGKKYTPVSFVSGNVANTYLYGYNSNGKLIYKKFIDTSVYE